MLGEHVVLADKLVKRSRTEPLGQRGGQNLRRFVF